MRNSVSVLEVFRLSPSLLTKAKGKQGQLGSAVLRLRNFGTKTTKLAQNFTTEASSNFFNSIRTSVCFGQKNYSRYISFNKSSSIIMSSPTVAAKKLCLDSYDIIGFDLDCTLLRYNLNEMLQLEYNALRRFLVEQRGYSPKLLEAKLNWDFLQKGLIIDAEHGNLMKLSHDAVILRASHGTRLLTDKEIEETYGPERKWSVSTQFHDDPISTWNGPASLQLRALLDYFDMPAGLVFAQVIDMIDAENQAKDSGGGNEPLPTLYKVWPDLWDGLMQIYSRDNFNNGTSEYFNALRAEPERYIMRTSDNTLKWLCELRASGKKLFLLTGSNIDFANNNATYAFGGEWQHLFDAVVCYAKKPGYFSVQRPYLCVDMEKMVEMPGTELSYETDLLLGKVYSQGNWHQLHRALSKSLGKTTTNAAALYFGDNIVQDVYGPVKHHDFDAVAVSEELMPIDAKDCDYEFAHAVSSKFWGSYFSVNGVPTLWSGMIAKYSQICIPSVESIVNRPLCQSIDCSNANGFYPKQPEELNGCKLTEIEIQQS